MHGCQNYTTKRKKETDTHRERERERDRQTDRRRTDGRSIVML